MNKQELIEAIVSNNNAGIETKAAAARALAAVLDSINVGIKKDGLVQLTGFGTFSIKERAARIGRNPLTGEKIKIRASKTVSFKVGAGLRETAKKTKIKK